MLAIGAPLILTSLHYTRDVWQLDKKRTRSCFWRPEASNIGDGADVQGRRGAGLGAVGRWASTSSVLILFSAYRRLAGRSWRPPDSDSPWHQDVVGKHRRNSMLLE